MSHGIDLVGSPFANLDASKILPDSMESSMKKGLGKLFAKTGKYMLKSLVDNFATKKQTDKYKKRMKGMKQGISIALDMLGIFLQILDAIGVLQPIMEIFSGVLAIIGGAVMENLMPALKSFAEALFGEEMMESWELLGELIAVLVEEGLGTFLAIIKAVLPILFVLLPVLILLTKAFGVLTIFGLLPIVATVFLIGLAIAMFVDEVMGLVSFITFGAIKQTSFAKDWTSLMLPLMGGLVAGMGEIIMLGTGGYVGPSSGGTHVIIGEGGEGEFVIPESKMSGIADANEKLLWATEDGNDKLDMLINIMNAQGRLR